MSARYPGYDVLAKYSSPSWNDKTRQVIDRRLAITRDPKFFSPSEWQTLEALCARILPQPGDRPPVPLAAYVDDKLHAGRRDGYRHADLPRQEEAWRIVLAGLDAAAQADFGGRFHELATQAQDDLVARMAEGRLRQEAWRGVSSRLLFRWRVMPDIVNGYYAHPTAWSEIGFGGPAGPRGYVRMGFDRRDPWEAAEARGDPEQARKTNRAIGNA
jgi:hypothetical protein